MANKKQKQRQEPPNDTTDIFSHCTTVINAALIQQTIRMLLNICRNQLGTVQHCPQVLLSTHLFDIVQLNRSCAALSILIEDGSVDEDGLVWYSSTTYDQIRDHNNKIRQMRSSLLETNFSLELN